MDERGARRVEIVYNALDLEAIGKMKAAALNPGGRQFTLLYFGTISEWLDLRSIMAVIDSQPDVVVRLAGPAEVELPKHPRLQYLGTVAHDRLGEVASGADAFVMPFHVNDLILSVDPVKVYEYIALGKPAIITRYPETVKFEPYVHLYRSTDELNAIVSELKRNPVPKASRSEIAAFVDENNWSERAERIEKLIESYVRQRANG